MEATIKVRTSTRPRRTPKYLEDYDSTDTDIDATQVLYKRLKVYKDCLVVAVMEKHLKKKNCRTVLPLNSVNWYTKHLKILNILWFRIFLGFCNVYNVSFFNPNKTFLSLLWAKLSWLAISNYYFLYLWNFNIINLQYNRQIWLFPFWAADPKGMMSYKTEGEFPSVRASVCCPTLCPAVRILGSQNVLGIADQYWSWAVFYRGSTVVIQTILVFIILSI